MNKLIKSLTGFCWIGPVAVLAYWQWLDNPTIITRDHNRVVETVSLKDVVHGSVSLHLFVDFCQSEALIPGTVERMVTNTGKHFLADTAARFDAGCYEGDRYIDIPTSFLEIGKNVYHFEGQYRVNPVKTMKAHTGPVTFEVVP